eukprot:CAMPEP_0203700486 /NCGR_PEP_ID=MMETSP0091-20130426/31393_1 /ASSEMBLY_ACC=CAM_ASM_001089 /TAXON_ID=426623 /ORGANISM="Chaetoceros affinis, Strain CCMP159" /LENGTH=263 /DNA_ID=CAMNT_0050573787 /DNA_START=38 /DNA_END=825 /DNA_ORIENTATION=+
MTIRGLEYHLINLFLWAGLSSKVPMAVLADSLDGLMVSCGGPGIGFKGENELECTIAGTDSLRICGSYSFDSVANTLSGTYDGSSWTASSLVQMDGILLTYIIDYGGVSGICNAFSLNYHNYGPFDSAFLKCPSQNAIIGVSYVDNGYTLDSTGSAQLRSKIELVAGSGDTIVNDSWGVYQWFGDGTIKMYFGPQQSRPLDIKEGLLDNSGLYVNGFIPPGPCLLTLTEFSLFTSIDQLPKLPKLPPGNGGGGEGGGGGGGEG